MSKSVKRIIVFGCFWAGALTVLVGCASSDGLISVPTESRRVIHVVDDADYVEPELLDENPIMIAGQMPMVPGELRGKRAKGYTQALVEIDERGYVRVLEFAKTTHPEMEAAFLEVAPTLRYTPPTSDGKPVKARFYIPFNYAPRALRVIDDVDTSNHYKAEELDEYPRKIEGRSPIAPKQLRDERIRGYTEALVEIDELGEVRVLGFRNTTHIGMEVEFLGVAAELRYTPPTVDGKPVKALFFIPFEFSPRR